MLINQFGNIYFEYYSILVHLVFAYQFCKLFLFSKPTKHFPLMVRYRYNTLPFCAKNFLIFFYDGSSIFRFLYFVSFLVQLFCFSRVIVNDKIYKLLFDFFFSDSSCPLGVFRTSPQLKTKITNIP